MKIENLSIKEMKKILKENYWDIMSFNTTHNTSFNTLHSLAKAIKKGYWVEEFLQYFDRPVDLKQPIKCSECRSNTFGVFEIKRRFRANLTLCQKCLESKFSPKKVQKFLGKDFINNLSY